jgi:hypothetical protein
MKANFKKGQKVAKAANKQASEYYLGFVIKTKENKSLVRFNRGTTNWVNNENIELVTK